MRIGSNPEKANKQLEIASYHRIVIPVYIPNTEEAYFKEALPILKYCLESLLYTVHAKSRISIINNASCAEVKDYLDTLYASHDTIDQLYHSAVNLGKINAVYSIVKGNIEPLITVTDADVMFLPGWQQAVEKVFEDFPKAGMVSPVPAPVAVKSSWINSTFYYGFVNRLFKFDDVRDPEALQLFQKSIGTALYKDIHLKKYLTLSKGEKKAAVGCGHFVATLRAAVFAEAPPHPTQLKIGGESLKNYIDKPNDDSGFLRLATMDNYAHHLGNTTEDWMHTKFESIATSGNQSRVNENLQFEVRGLSKMQRFIGKVLYRIFVKTKPIKRLYFSSKGMKDPNF